MRQMSTKLKKRPVYKPPEPYYNMRITLNVKPIEGLKWENFLSFNKEQFETREYYSHYCPFNVNAMMANCFPYPFGFNCGCAHDKKKIISSDIIHKDDYECACVCTKEKY